MTRMDQFRQPAPTPARKKLSFGDHRDFDIGPAVDYALAELGYVDEPAPVMSPDQAIRYLDLLIAVNGRAMAEHGVEYVPRDQTIPPGEDFELRPHQIEIPARDILVLLELAGQLGMDISHF